MKLLEIAEGSVSVEFERFDLDHLSTIVQLAADAAIGDTSTPENDLAVAYASLFGAFVEVSNMAAAATMGGCQETLSAQRAADLYYSAHSLKREGDARMRAARRQYPKELGDLEALNDQDAGEQDAA